MTLNEIDFDRVVDEAVKFIEMGKREIKLDPQYREVVLVVGLTGAGKTTISQFITGKPQLSYKKGRSFLIKDAGRFSKNTIVSKTIFPDMFIDNETNTVYFDLPGFSDSSNASVELANAAFMKMVADHATRVKILFVVSYTSLQPGQIRTDLKDLLSHSIAFIKNPRKFQPAIALAVSKVQSYDDSNYVIPAVVAFLETEKEHSLGSIFNDKDRRLATELLDAFLTEIESDDGMPTYPRIGVFKQPNMGGMLSEIPDMIEQRRFLKSIVENQTQFVKTSDGDFGIRISDRALLYVRTIVEKLNENFETSMEQLSEACQRDYENYLQLLSNNKSSLPSVVGRIVTQYQNLLSTTKQLDGSTSRQNFIDILVPFVTNYDLLATIMTDIKIQHRLLKFYEGIDGRSIAPKIREWVRPLKDILPNFHNSTRNLVARLNLLLLQEQQGTIDVIVRNYNFSRQDPISLPSSQNLNADIKILEQLINLLLNQPTFNSYLNVSRTYLLKFSGSNIPKDYALNLIITKDIQFESTPELKREAWVLQFYVLLQFLSETKFKIDDLNQQRLHAQAVTNLQADRERLLQLHSIVTAELEFKERQRLDEIKQLRETLQVHQAELVNLRQTFDLRFERIIQTLEIIRSDKCDVGK